MVVTIKQTAKSNQQIQPSNGFSLVETLVGVVILCTLLYSANKAIALAMNSSKGAGERGYIENAIMNDIERIRMVDDHLNKKENVIKSCQEGGSNGAKYLMQTIQTHNSKLKSIGGLGRQFSTTDSKLLRISYHFNTPDNGGKPGIEKRILEIHPSFLAQCS
jgi:type II secretory pathway pseudopilin PulG